MDSFTSVITELISKQDTNREAIASLLCQLDSNQSMELLEYKSLEELIEQLRWLVTNCYECTGDSKEIRAQLLLDKLRLENI